MKEKIDLTDADFHQHITSRMSQRGISREEIQTTLNEGRNAEDCKSGTYGKVMCFQYQNEWEGKYFEEKEVTIYYKIKDDRIILLTVKARYGQFKKGGMI